MNDSNQELRPLVSLSWQSVVYGIGIFGRQLAVYLALPLFTGNMPQKEYGIVAVMSSFLAFLSVLTNAGLPAATFRLYNENDDNENRKLTLGAGQQLIAAFALLASVCMIVFAPGISKTMFGTPDAALLVRIAAIQLLIESLVNYGTILLRLEIRPLATSVQSLIHVTAQLALSILLVMKFKMGALGYFSGFAAGAGVGLLYMIWLVRHSLAFKLSGLHVIAMLKYGLPLIPATLSLWALNLVDRTLISWMVGLDRVAVYDIGYRIGLLAGLAMVPLSTAWPQFAFSIMNKPHARQVYQNTLTFCTALFLFVALGVIAVEKYLVSLLAPNSYEAAVSIVPWVALAQVAWGVYPILVVGLHITKKTGHIALVTVLAAVTNVAMNLILLPRIGILGGAIATLGAYGVLAAGAYMVGRRHYYYPIDWVRMRKLAIAGLVTGFLLIILDRSSVPLIPDLLMRASILLLFVVILMVSNFISINQVQGAWKFGKDAFQSKFGAS